MGTLHIANANWLVLVQHTLIACCIVTNAHTRPADALRRLHAQVRAAELSTGTASEQQVLCLEGLPGTGPALEVRKHITP